MRKILASAAVAGTMLAASVLPAFADDNHSVNIQGDNNGKININNGTINNDNTTINLTDIGGHWAQDAITRLVKSGVLHGDQNHHFNPDNSMKRDEFAVMVANYFHLQNNSTTQDFADVSPNTDPGTWCFNAVESTKNYMTSYQFPPSTVTGSVYQSVYAGGYFLPEQDVQRQQVATTLVRLLEAAGKLSPVSTDQASTILSSKFKDAST
ncbi:MAG: xynA1 9, partial [Bacilli bacterium]|nr:xynA1 9 [Bacilli bacterium]